VVGTLEICDPTVVSPIPWCPPSPWLPEYFAGYRRVVRHRVDDGVDVHHPRLLIGPGSSLRSLEATLYYSSVRRMLARLHSRHEFDLVHAHFTYPDGVVGARVARWLGLPLVITEQAPWGPWVDESRRVREQVIDAVRQSSVLVAISHSVKESISPYVGASGDLRVVPDAIDGSVFTLPRNGTVRDERQILFTGAIRPVKGVDVLLEAMRLLAERRIDAHLVLVGEAYYKTYRQEHDRLRALTVELGLEDRVDFRGPASRRDLVRTMQESAVLVLPSRAESLGMVLVEALACGTPVVATRCGGPEDIVDDSVGALVPPESPADLAAAIASVLERRATFDPRALRAHALERFSLESVRSEYAAVYSDALRR
jgi:glycosyltransferase involved in cell wall biosynthesis